MDVQDYSRAPSPEFTSSPTRPSMLTVGWILQSTVISPAIKLVVPDDIAAKARERGLVGSTYTFGGRNVIPSESDVSPILPISIKSNELIYMADVSISVNSLIYAQSETDNGSGSAQTFAVGRVVAITPQAYPLPDNPIPVTTVEESKFDSPPPIRRTGYNSDIDFQDLSSPLASMSLVEIEAGDVVVNPRQISSADPNGIALCYADVVGSPSYDVRYVDDLNSIMLSVLSPDVTRENFYSIPGLSGEVICEAMSCIRRALFTKDAYLVSAVTNSIRLAIEGGSFTGSKGTDDEPTGLYCVFKLFRVRYEAVANSGSTNVNAGSVRSMIIPNYVTYFRFGGTPNRNHSNLWDFVHSIISVGDAWLGKIMEITTRE